ncbi:MAG: hypothetical protein RL572_1018 [Pseudomonadota bacterium]|jgi:hypothetical protein
MQQSYTAVYRREGAWWLGWVKEVPGVNCQERTKEALKRSLVLTLREALSLDRHNRQSISTFKDEMVIYEEDRPSEASAQA